MSDTHHNNHSNDGRLMDLITGVGNALLLNILFLVCSLPVVTFGASLSAFYYSMIKNVRCERSYPAKEFFRAFKRNLIKGSCYTIVIILAVFLLLFNRTYYLTVAAAETSSTNVVLASVCDVFLVFLAALTVWLFPILSRFAIDIKRTLRLTVTIAVKHFYFTLLLMAGIALTVFLIIRMSVGFTLIIPAAACFGATYIIEPVFHRYIPAPEENVDPWFYSGE